MASAMFACATDKDALQGVHAMAKHAPAAVSSPGTASAHTVSEDRMDAHDTALRLEVSKQTLHTGGQASVSVGALNGMPVIVKAFKNTAWAQREQYVHDAVYASCKTEPQRQMFVPLHRAFTYTVDTPPSRTETTCTANEMCLMDMHELLEPLWDDVHKHRLDLSTNVPLRRLLRDVVSGVAHMHAHGVAHNDLKLCNIFVSTQDTSRVYSAENIAASDLQPNDSVAETCLAHVLRRECHTRLVQSVQSPRDGIRPSSREQASRSVAAVYNDMRTSALSAVKEAKCPSAALTACWFRPSAKMVARVGDMGVAQVAPAGCIPLRRTLQAVSCSLSPPELLNAMALRSSTTEFDELSMDVYALGVLVYTALTGSMPYNTPDPSEPRFRGFMRTLHGSGVHMLHECMQSLRGEWNTDVHHAHYGAYLSTMSSECRQFLRACMHPNPARRCHAAMLLQLPFLQVDN